MVDNHRSALMFKHSSLDAQIVAEERRPAPDTSRLAHLKKEKLRLKDALQT